MREKRNSGLRDGFETPAARSTHARALGNTSFGHRTVTFASKGSSVTEPSVLRSSDARTNARLGRRGDARDDRFEARARGRVERFERDVDADAFERMFSDDAGDLHRLAFRERDLDFDARAGRHLLERRQEDAVGSNGGGDGREPDAEGGDADLDRDRRGATRDRHGFSNGKHWQALETPWVQ